MEASQEMRGTEDKVGIAQEIADALKATADREAIERIAAEAGEMTMGALRPKIGPKFGALVLQRRYEEAKAHRALQEAVMKKGKVAKEAN